MDLSDHPVNDIQWVPLDKVEPNDYNPNSVAEQEMALLRTSILHDGYTQPVVVCYHPERDKYEIIDGFHRYWVVRTYQDIYDWTGGHCPVAVVHSDKNQRMASTIRHNRARGKHSVNGMSNLVFTMLQNGWADEDICNQLGMEPEELLRLKHITGFSKLFKDHTYNRAWKTESQIKVEREYSKG